MWNLTDSPKKAIEDNRRRWDNEGAGDLRRTRASTQVRHLKHIKTKKIYIIRDICKVWTVELYDTEQELPKSFNVRRSLTLQVSLVGWSSLNGRYSQWNERGRVAVKSRCRCQLEVLREQRPSAPLQKTCPTGTQRRWLPGDQQQPQSSSSSHCCWFTTRLQGRLEAALTPDLAGASARPLRHDALPKSPRPLPPPHAGQRGLIQLHTELEEQDTWKISAWAASSWLATSGQHSKKEHNICLCLCRFPTWDQ